jgi:pimeloyl-ACP methyl ester carboxylesterase
MKRILTIVGAVAILAGAGAASYVWLTTINRTQLVLHDDSRDRDVPIQISESNWIALKARFGFPRRVAIVSQGNTVKHTEYSFVGPILFSNGYMVVSIQHDLPGDPPLSQSGYPFVGRLPAYERAVANIDFVLSEMKKLRPDADYDHLALLGHSNGGDISMFYARQRQSHVDRIVTLDNLRVPLLLAKNGPKILTIRSNDWRPDPDVVPNDETCLQAGIEVVQTTFQHIDMSDRGPEAVKAALTVELKRFLSKNYNETEPNKTIDINWQVGGA